MYARVTIFQIQPGKVDEAIRIYRDSVVPAAQQQKGFKGKILLTDHNTSKIMSMALWETEADMKAGESSGYFQQLLAKFKGLLGAPSVYEHYEVSVRT